MGLRRILTLRVAREGKLKPGGGGGQQKFRPTWAALGAGVGRTLQPAMGPPKNSYNYTLGGDPRQNNYRDPGTPTFPGDNLSKSCRRTPVAKGDPT